METKSIILLQAALLAACLIAQATSSTLRRNKFADDSCAGRCNQTGTVPGAPCQCNSACTRFNDCCSDYYSLCLGQSGSCAGRCDQSGTVPGTCQCNKPCVDFGDCCPDYADLCRPSDGTSDEELENLAELLLSLDTVNNATQYITVDLQGKTSSGSDRDDAPNPLLTVAASAFTRTTIEKMTALQDNYDPDTNNRETYTPEQEAEIDSFITAIWNTPIMQATQEFLVSKNLASGRETFYEMWFGLYSRGNGIVSSCGFEHAFVGELKSNEVSGFHNWEQFAVEESKELVNYMGYMNFVDLGWGGSIIEHKFTWQSKGKPRSSMFIGTSPELELALYTICFRARPNSQCPVSLSGKKFKIQTYTIGSNDQYVATSYPDISGVVGLKNLKH